MAGMTLRFRDDDQHIRLRLLAAAHGVSANELILNLIDERARQELHQDRANVPGTSAERLRRALGWDNLPEITDADKAEADRRLTQATTDAAEFYGKGTGAAAA